MSKSLILCLDDDPDLLYLHRVVLERAGYDVLSATEAAEAMRLLDANPIDMVITDHVMPGKSGEHAFYGVASTYFLANIIAVFLPATLLLLISAALRAYSG